ncbi:hypothetical protein [Microlunatus ginsengisoli]|uniref:Uncharacterized protein n=1 Tax=Microlunatus ginsengisoli TaxID=363863 RepID=A0ABP7AKJ9_9ACTN
MTINVDPHYAGSLGALALIDGKLDCDFVSGELKSTDGEAVRGEGRLRSYRHFGFLDSMGFVVHKDNPTDKLSRDRLDAILSTTRTAAPPRSAPGAISA